jgi:hypothetical protein
VIGEATQAGVHACRKVNTLGQPSIRAVIEKGLRHPSAGDVDIASPKLTTAPAPRAR